MERYASQLACLLNVRRQPESLSHIDEAGNCDGRALVVGAKTVLGRDLPEVRLDELWTMMLDGRTLGRLASHFQPALLNVRGTHTTDLAWTGRLERLTRLALEWNTKLTSLDFLQGCNPLQSLAIHDCKKVTDLQPLRSQPGLTALSIRGGIWSPMRVATFSPLADLESLTELALFSLVGERSLEPLTGLTALRRLDLQANLAPMEDYARLAAALPDTECEAFNGYVPSRGAVTAGADPVDYLDELGDADVFMVGGRGPCLNARRDRDRILKRLDRFFAVRDGA